MLRMFGPKMDKMMGSWNFIFELFEIRDVLSILTFSFSFECTSWKVPENQEGLGLNGAHWHQFCTDDANFLGKTQVMKIKPLRALLNASKEGRSRCR